MSQTKILDALDMEFQYYSCLVKDLFELLPSRCEQRMVNAWLRKLSDPVYNANSLRDKRNRYLLMLCICMNLNCLRYPFDCYPPEGELGDIKSIKNPAITESNCFEVASQEKGSQSCDLHKTECPKDNDNVGKVLDEQFQYVISISEPHVSQLSDPSDRQRARDWVVYLSSINSTCFHMKGLRNDYAMLLSGYLINNELPGPFMYPPIENLVPLEDLVKMVDMKNHMAFDPSDPKTLKFFKDVPHPEEGAFAFISVSGGELCNSFFKHN